MSEINETVQTKLYDAVKSIVDEVTSNIDWYQILLDNASFEQAAADAVKEAMEGFDAERLVEEALSEIDIEDKVQSEVDNVDFENLAREAISDVDVDEVVDDAVDQRLDAFERKLKLADAGLSGDKLNALIERVASLELRLNDLAGFVNKYGQRIDDIENSLRTAAVEFSILGRKVENQ